MPRWTRTSGHVTERWHLDEVDGALVERWGRDGTPLRARTQSVPHDGTRALIAQRMIRQREGEGYVRDDDASRAPAAASPSDAVALRVRGLDGGDAHAYREALCDGGPWAQAGTAAWAFAAREPEETARRPGLWELLAEHLDDCAPATACAVLAAVPEGRGFEALFPRGRPRWFTPGGHRALDALAHRAWHLDHDLVTRAAATWPAPMQTLLAFAVGRSGGDVPRAVASRIRRHAARAHMTGGLATHGTLALGAGEEPARLDDDGVAAVMARLGGDDAWWAELRRAARGARQLSLGSLRPLLTRCPLDELAALLARCGSFGTDVALAEVLDALDRRGDRPEALHAASEAVRAGATTEHARRVSEALAMQAAAAWGALGEDVPESLDALLTFAFVSTVYRASLGLAARAWRALPPARALSLCRAQLAQPWAWPVGLAVLTVVDDDALLADYLARDRAHPALAPALLARFGLRALDPLVAMWDDTPRDERATRHRQILHVMAALGDDGVTVDARCDRFVRFDVEGHDDLTYWDEARASLRHRALRALPKARREEALARAAAGRYPERAEAARRALRR